MNRFAVVLTVALLLQACLFYAARATEKVPGDKPLEFFPRDFQGWRTAQEGHLAKDEQDVLRADDTLYRVYVGPAAPGGISMFVAYFRSQRAGQAPHSPKNCLPGSGWEQVQDGYIDVAVEGEPAPITINRYIVQNGESARVVLYWYQSRKRIIASEYSAKFWLVADSNRYHRSDTALVRIEAPLLRGDDAQATRNGVAFVQAMFPLLMRYLPS
jgi:EpsI family protein